MKYVDLMIEKHPELVCVKESAAKAVELIATTHRDGGKILLCGNGGSYADCEHIAGELLKGFIKKRVPEGKELKHLTEGLGEVALKLQRGICAIPLPSVSGALSAYINDVEPSLAYAQLVYAMGRPGDLLIAISTSGCAENVVNAAKCAKALGLSVISLTGESGGELLDLSDVCVRAPENTTYKIQEYHLPIYHAICLEVEDILF